MYNDYDIKTVSLITSQYHLKRGSILYYTMSLLKAEELGVEPIAFLGEGNAGWFREDKTEEPMSLKANSMYSIADVERSENLPFSKLENLNIEGYLEYYLNEKLNLKVYAQYDNGYLRDVTKLADITGYDPNTAGDQQLEISYEENGKLINKNVTVTVLEETPSVASMQELVESLQDKGEFSDADAARALDIHLVAVKRFEETEQTEKVLKHLHGFQNLLEYQQNEGLISDYAYDLLRRDTEYLIEGHHN
ncbi:hypothetical protein KK120_22795 [Virgibacillus dakarensis]|nr:hypothetical protein [Virgibacillus dakarensis]